MREFIMDRDKRSLERLECRYCGNRVISDDEKAERMRKYWEWLDAWVPGTGIRIHPRVFELNLEHVIPRKHGGQTVVSNLVIACRWCTSAKGTGQG